MAAVIKDVVVLLPGLLGSVLQREGKEIWGLSGSAIFRALFSGLGSVKSLTLKSDAGGALADDGVEAVSVLPDTHLIPGLWKVDGYTRVAETLVDRLGLIPGANFFEFPYDWRRDIRFTAKRLQEQCARWLHTWRHSNGGSPDARLILVGHSMGGVVSRYFLECLGGWKDTRALITFGTPHRGSFMALQALALGFRKDLGPVNLVDLTEMVRSLPSAYQLLPMYPCVQLPDGRMVRPGEAPALGGMDPARAAQGLAFHREIMGALETNAREAAYVERGYHLHPVVGTFQPTLQGARLNAAGGLEMLWGEADGTDHGGDGTVPRVSALPLEERHQVRAMYSPTSHASLQNAFEVLAHVEGVITGQHLQLDKYRDALFGPAPRMLSLSLEDAFGHDEPVPVRVRPSAEPVALRAYVSNVKTGESFAEPLVRGPDGFHTGTFRPLPPGMYRLSVKGGPEVIPVSDVFAVFHRAGELPDDEETREFCASPGIPGGPARDMRSAVPAASPPPPAGQSALDHVPQPAVRDEGQTITRYPSVEPIIPARAGQPFPLTVDLALAEVGPETESAGVQMSGLAADWKELPVKVRLLCSEMTFRPGADTGVVLVRRNDSSIAATLTGTVNAGATGELTVVATFEYEGRFCGAARRRVPIESSGTGGPGPSTSRAPSGGGGAGGLSAASDDEARGTFALEAGAQKPHLTVQIHRLDPSSPQRLFWMLQVSVPCEGLPARLSGEHNLGSDPAAFFQSVANTARELRAGEHFAWFMGLGKLLYQRAPHVFRETYKALRQQYGAGFPIQFITDDPHIPWELMSPADVPGAELLCMEHPVARWLLDYQTSLTSRLMRGDILTIAPDYQFHPHLAPLPQAQEESRQLGRRFRAVKVAGRRQPLMSLLGGSYPNRVALLHFAGHGKYSANNEVSPSCVYLEDGELKTLEVRSAFTMLGQKSRPLVIFNACEVGTATDMLGGIGGWAETFVSEKFAGFIAPLWPVQDAHARTAVEQLVTDLWEKQLPVGEALRRLRQSEAKTSPTYLSYVYVGDVMARFSQSAAA
ncbi:lipase/acyltransferase domain-containing protein [Archangium primigenium]|uniref:lipase/acyltransferase domain-containing protein n=1 Tax=[Archangium] primigenium TaxID=2792470 RepID=UPI00195947E8|nr:CHAT domain-containing protein [Archangium primigenium]MBM7118868.1 CHAT domain-containing protein [Archangium primigenium]